VLAHRRKRSRCADCASSPRINNRTHTRNGILHNHGLSMDSSLQITRICAGVAHHVDGVEGVADRVHIRRMEALEYLRTARPPLSTSSVESAPK